MPVSIVQKSWNLWKFPENLFLPILLYRTFCAKFPEDWHLWIQLNINADNDDNHHFQETFSLQCLNNLQQFGRWLFHYTSIVFSHTTVSENNMHAEHTTHHAWHKCHPHCEPLRVSLSHCKPSRIDLSQDKLLGVCTQHLILTISMQQLFLRMFEI